MIISEYRSYELPADFPLLALHGDNWLISPVHSPHLHFHNCVEIGLCRRGSGEMTIGEEQFSFSGGTVTFIAPSVQHTTWSAPDTQSLWSYLFVDVSGVLKSLAMELPDYRKYTDMIVSGAFLLDPESNPWAAPLVTSLVREATDCQPGYQSSIRGLLLSMMVRLQRIGFSPRVLSVPSSAVLNPALDYIRQNYAEDFPMEFLADLCHLSPTHFRRLFRQQIGTNPLDFLHQVRIATSCSLLLSSAAGIAEIANTVGYSSLSCFNRHFLRFMRVSPSRWRRIDDESARRSVLSFTGWNQPETSDEILSRKG